MVRSQASDRPRSGQPKRRWIHEAAQSAEGLGVRSIIGIVCAALGLELIAGRVANWDVLGALSVAVGPVLLLIGIAIAWRVAAAIRQRPFDFTRTADGPPTPCQVLILPLSLAAIGTPDGAPYPRDTLTIDARAHDPVDRILAWPADDIQPLRLGALASIGEFNDAVRGAELRLPWSPALRAVEHHLPMLEWLAVVGSSSPGRNSSHDQIPDFVALLTILLGEAPSANRPARTIRLLEVGDDRGDLPAGFLGVVDRDSNASAEFEGVDFGSILDIHDRVCQLVDELGSPKTRNQGGELKRSVALDATGGTKPVSVGIAIASLESSAWLQYVDEDLRITGYNYRLSESPSVNVG